MFLERKLEIRMRLVRYLLLCLLAAVFSNLHAQCGGDELHRSFLNQRDYEAVQEFVNSKRTISLIDKDRFLKIHGDIRTNVYYRIEKQGALNLRGRDTPFPRGSFEAELNLRMDYKAERTWAHLHVQESNIMGIGPHLGQTCGNNPEGLFGSGFCNDLCLRRAYFGWRVYECKEVDKLDIEIGRRPMYTFMDSRIEFNSRFDGVMAKYTRQVQKNSNAYLTIGSFLINEHESYFGYLGETGILNLLHQRIDLKYSYIYWDRNGFNQCGVRNPVGTMFRVSQWSLGWDFPKDAFGKKARIYGAYLRNSAAERIPQTNFTYANMGWYAGFIIGEVFKQGDWSFDMNYQYVQAQAVPENDARGIGRGNVLKETLTAEGRGRTNFKGWHFEGLVAVTDDLSIDAIYDFSVPVNRQIGGYHRYSKLEVDVIWAF